MPKPSRTAPRVLVLCDLPKVKKSILDTVGGMSLPAIDEATPSAAFHTLDGERSLDIVIVALRLTGKALVELLAAIRVQLGKREVKIIVVISPGQARNSAALLQHADDLDFKPIRQISLKLRLQLAVHQIRSAGQVDTPKIQPQAGKASKRTSKASKLSAIASKPDPTIAIQLPVVPFHDSIVTAGLNSRSGFLAALDSAYSPLAQGEKDAYAVVCLDLDRLRNINYSFGYRIGDRLLEAVASRLCKWAACPNDQLSQAPVCAHLSGSLFGILLGGISSSQLAVRLTKDVQICLQQEPFVIDEHTIYVTASAGIAVGDSAHESSDEVLRNADAALRRAKDVGRGAWTLYDSSMQTHAAAFLKMETALRRAIENDELRVFFQPIVRLDNETIAGFEALVRWPRDDGSFFDTNEFVIVAEQSGLVIALDRFVMREACHQVRAWNNLFRRKEPLTVSVNISGAHFMHPDMLAEIDKTLRSFGLYGRSLRLEITETCFMETASYAADLLRQLKAMNIGISVDDFGTGYSSLAYLRRFEVDTLKISSAFVSKMDSDQDSWEIVRTILSLANNLGKQAVAEGVETERQKELLAALRCPFAQGFLFSEAVEAQKVHTLLAAEARGENPFRSLSANTDSSSK